MSTTPELIRKLNRPELIEVVEGDPISIQDWSGAIFIEWVHDGSEPLCANVLTLEGERRVRAGRIIKLL